VAKKIGADRKRSSATLPGALGAELTDRRMKAGWSQQALADLLGYDVNYIGQVERAEKSPTLDTLISISTVFRIRLSELLRGAEERLSSGHGSDQSEGSHLPDYLG
jgi:transcriptional regulator with XRE-family HTH domain